MTSSGSTTDRIKFTINDEEHTGKKIMFSNYAFLVDLYGYSNKISDWFAFNYLLLNADRDRSNAHWIH